MPWNLVTSIRDKVQGGALPLPPDPAGKCWVGKGTSRPCDACDASITAEQVEYELDLPDGRTLRFHSKCLAAWHEFRAERMHE
jgi:hypothetical protein